MDIFIHIPKASGTTIRTILSREYGAKAIAYYEPETESDANTNPEAELKSRLAKGNVALITGHMRFGIHEFLRRPCRYFSMVRNPVERALSDYFYAFSYPNHRFREPIVTGGMSFADFVAEEAKSSSGAATHFLSGWFTGLHGDTEAALFHIQHCFSVVGISERFDESVLLMARELGWKPPLFLRRNVTKLTDALSDRRARAKQEALRNLDRFFANDLSVYHMADRLLTQRVDHLGQKFALALANFKEMQAVLNRYEDELIFGEYNFEQDDELPPPISFLVRSTPYRALEEYLNEGAQNTVRRRAFVGYFDGRSRSDLAGWAMELASSNPIKVSLRNGDDVVATTSCTIDRPDVAATGFPATPCGFRFNLDPPVEKLEDLSICFEDTPIKLRS